MSKTTAGNYTVTSKFQPAGPTELLYGGGLYRPIESTPLKIIEVAANPDSCSPVVVKASCLSYIKRVNTTNAPFDSAGIRLRLVDSQTVASITNAVVLAGIIPAGGTVSIKERDDLKPLNITSTAGYAWL